MNIEGKLIILRAIEDKDTQLINKWANSPEIWQYLGGWHFPYSLNNTRNWISNINNSDIHNQIFAIESRDIGLIGTTNLINIDWKNRNAFHGIMLGDKESRGKGYAQDVVMTLMRFAFDELGLHRLDGDMISSNTRSIDFYKNKCGWEIEGVKKNWFFRNGVFFDKVIVGITRERYLDFIKKIDYF